MAQTAIANQQPPTTSNGNGHAPSAPPAWTPSPWRQAAVSLANRGQQLYRTVDGLKGADQREAWDELIDLTERYIIVTATSDHDWRRGDWGVMEAVGGFAREWFKSVERCGHWSAGANTGGIIGKLFESASILTQPWTMPGPRRYYFEPLAELLRQKVPDWQICSIYRWMLAPPPGSPSGFIPVPDLATLAAAVRGEIQPPEFEDRPVAVPGPAIKPQLGLAGDCRERLMQERGWDDAAVERVIADLASGRGESRRNARGVGVGVPGNRPARAYSNVQGDAVQSGDESDGFGESQFFSV